MSRLLIFALAVFILASLPWGASHSASDPKAPIALKFECLWWSAAQMEGIDPDHPPTKTTATVIEKWEYSDPIGVPHPDSVDLVGVVKSSSGLREVFAKVERRWKVGPLKSPNKARWERWGLSSSSTIKIPEKGDFKLSSVDIKGKMDPLFAKNRWPFELQMRVTLYSDPAHKTTLAELTARLPLQPGD